MRKLILARRSAAWRPKAPRLVLWLGFGGLLACIIAAAAGTLIGVGRVRQDETRIRRNFMRRLDALDQIRAQIYLSGTYIRDVLLSPAPLIAKAQSFRLASLEYATKSALHSYSQSLAPEEQQPFQALESEIEAYWQVLDQVVAWTPEQRNRLRDSFFYDELVPRRNAMLQIADRIAVANEHSLTRSEEQLNSASHDLRRILMVTFTLTFAVGLLLAAVTIVHTTRLETELERRLEENARARNDLQELSAKLLRAQENERRSLARELHDEVGQSLSAILMESQGAEFAEDPEELKEHLAAVRTLAEKTVNEVRDLALLLRPSMLDDFGLVPALNWHAREMTKRTGMNVVLSADDAADDLPDEHTTCIYRLVQEAVNNAARHANARNVEVDVRREEHRVIFSVRDDGAGFDPRFVRGLGLLGMEERVRRLGGELEIDSQPGGGTRITAELPLTETTHREEQDAHTHSVG